MDERILVEFERGGEVVPVTAFRSTHSERHETGIVLHDETSASPRGFLLHLRPLSPGTQEKFQQVQRRHDWLNPARFEIEPSREGSRLRLGGVDGGSLPPGRYELKLRVGGMVLEPAVTDVDIPANGAVVVRFREKIAQRLVLNRPVTEFDANSRRILTDPNSELDGMNAADWLASAKHRDRRKAVLLNVLSKLAAIPVAKPQECLSRQVKSVFFAELDRIYCGATAEFHAMVKDTFRKDSAIHSTHRRLLSRLGPSAENDYSLISYREKKGKASLQAVVAVPRAGLSDQTHYVDLDIDKANPGFDLMTFFIHVGEVLDPNETDHLKLFSKLDRKQVGDFVYYDVAKV
jgi:hypothetical protein